MATQDTLSHKISNGRRRWLMCIGCRRGCRKIYGGRYFRCRKCQRLRYASQREWVRRYLLPRLDMSDEELEAIIREGYKQIQALKAQSAEGPKPLTSNGHGHNGRVQTRLLPRAK